MHKANVILVLIAILSCCGCAITDQLEMAISPQGMTTKALDESFKNQPAPPILNPWGHQIGEFAESSLWKVTELGFKSGPNILQAKGPKLDYKIEKIEGPNNQAFVLWYTYKDEEDGGNSYGWVEDLNGNKVGNINDCFLEHVK